MSQDQRSHDIVLFGATGYTGALTAEYLARNAPEGFRWALAGRSMPKLEVVRERLTELDPGLADLTLLEADVTDAASLKAVAESTRVMITTVGPYIEYGEPVVAACAEAGTDYVDLTGEPEFVDQMYLRWHKVAQTTGARIVHACGLDSIPHDLGVWYTVQQLPEAVPLRIRGMLRASLTPSGGTVASAMSALSRARHVRRAAAERRQMEPRPEGRRARSGAKPPHRDSSTGWWLLPLPTLDPLVVRRSAVALDRYGPDFEYSHYLALKRLPVAVGAVAGAAAVATAAQVPPLRRFLMDRMPQGQGPSEEQREKAWFRMRFVGDGGGQRVVTEVSGEDPGYGGTAKMVAESALCLAFDDNPPTAGNVTTATAMAANLVDRLQRAGMKFEVLENI